MKNATVKAMLWGATGAAVVSGMYLGEKIYQERGGGPTFRDRMASFLNFRHWEIRHGLRKARWEADKIKEELERL